MTLPNFIVIGAAKAGTTSLHWYLAEHPSVFMTTTKDPSFFAYGLDAQGKLLWGDPEFHRFPVKTLAEYERLFDDGADPHPRIQRRIGILKHDLHVAPRLAQARPRELQDVLAAKRDVARRRFDQPQDAAPGRRLAAAGFADEAEGLAFLDRERHVVDGADDGAVPQPSAAAAEFLDEMADLEERHQETRSGAEAARGS